MLVQVIKSIEDTKFNKMLMVRKSEYWCCQLLAWKSCRGKFPICNIIVVQSTKLYLPAGTFSINQICWCNGKAASHTYIDSFPSLPQFALHHKHFVYALPSNCSESHVFSHVDMCFGCETFQPNLYKFHWKITR